MTSNDDRLPIGICLILMALISAILWVLIFLSARSALAVDCERLPQLCQKSVASKSVKASRASARKVKRVRAARTVTAQRRVKHYRKRVPVNRAAPLPAHPAAVATPTPLPVGTPPAPFTVADRIGLAHADILAITVEDAPAIQPVLVRTASHPPVAPQEPEAVRVIEAPYQATVAASEVRATWADHPAGKISILATFLAIMAALALGTFKGIDVTRLKEIRNDRKPAHRAKSFVDRQTQALSRIGRRAKGICRTIADAIAERRRARKRVAEARQYKARAARAPAPYLPRAQERRRPHPVRYRAA